MDKKSQVKFGETIGVIIIVYIVLMAGLIWYNNINNKDLIEIQNKNLQDKAFEKYHFIVNLDLIHKSERGDIDEEFSLISLRTLSNYSKTKIGNKYLRDRLATSTISIDIYNKSTFNKINETNIQESILLYNSTPNKNQRIREEPIYKTLVPIRDEENNVNVIGVLKVKSYILR